MKDPNGKDGRIFFMTKQFESSEIQGNSKSRKFEFILESTVEDEKLIDAYVGVEFSVVYKITATCRTKSNNPLLGEMLFYAACPGTGIDPRKGRNLIS